MIAADIDAANRLVLSCAGTEFETDKLRDLVTDAQIGTSGYAVPQAVPLYRYIKKLQTGAGDRVIFSVQMVQGRPQRRRLGRCQSLSWGSPSFLTLGRGSL